MGECLNRFSLMPSSKEKNKIIAPFQKKMVITLLDPSGNSILLIEKN